MVPACIDALGRRDEMLGRNKVECILKYLHYYEDVIFNNRKECEDQQRKSILARFKLAENYAKILLLSKHQSMDIDEMYIYVKGRHKCKCSIL